MRDSKIIFLNQMAGPLFRELAEDIATELGHSILFTGHNQTVNHHSVKKLDIIKGIAYNRSNFILRVFTWTKYFVDSIYLVLKSSDKTLLFINTNPPYLGLVGSLFKSIRKQDYAILIYDIYPELLISLGKLKEGRISKFWRKVNGCILRDAKIIFTINTEMAEYIDKVLQGGSQIPKKIFVISNWVDVNIMKPKLKKDNWFAIQHDLIDKFVILYSGNMGYSHDIESIIEIARKMKANNNVQFVFIGEGEKYSLTRQIISSEQLNNILILPFQPEEALPFSIPAADIGIVSYQIGTEKYMEPSKIYYYMASGVIPFVLSMEESSLAKMVQDNNCGFAFKNIDTELIVKKINELFNDQKLQKEYKKSSRAVSEKLFSRSNTNLYIDELKKYYNN